MRRMYENRRGEPLRDIHTRDFKAAKKLREVFTDRPSKKVIDLGWTWPKAMDEVGVCTAVMYSSDKWKRIGDFEDYKHITETDPDQHKLLIGKHFDLGVDVYCENRELTDMPDAIAELANILGIQYRLYDADGRLGEQDYQVNIVRAKLGAARHANGETMLLVYSRSVLCCLITGFEVEKDGIVL